MAQVRRQYPNYLIKEVNPPQRTRNLRLETYKTIMATSDRVLQHRASTEILLCRILYFMAGTGLLVD
jgi:hypothetical protein